MATTTRGFGGATRIVAACLSLALLAGIGFVLHGQQRKSRADTVTRFNLRSEIGARFLGSYLADLTSHETELATARLADRSVSQAEFVEVTESLGFQASVLLDEDGRLLRVVPNDRNLLGVDLSAKYEHLRAATAGEVAVSDVVPSAVQAVPVVAVAVPFESAIGPRVFSGALTISDTSMGTSYLRNITPIPGASAWLIDGAGRTVASSSDGIPTPDLLQERDPALLDALGGSGSGVYDGPVALSRFAAFPVDGTSWRLVVAAPESQLLAAVGGLNEVLPWIVFAGLGIAVATAMLLQIRLAQSRARQLRDVSLLSLTDPMTGLYNRRGFGILAAHLLKDADRERRWVALMFFDMDGLKTINDSLGHGAGNEALIATAALLRSTFRDSDVIARMGGDEFCVIGMLPGPPNDGSAQLARLDAALELYNAREQIPFHLGLSGGVALRDPQAPRPLAALEEEADRLMHLEKGRKNGSPHARREEAASGRP